MSSVLTMCTATVTAVLCLLLPVHSQSTMPTPHIELASSTVWKCMYSPGSTVSLQELLHHGHTHNIEILHSSSTSEVTAVELITSLSSEHELEQIGLTECEQLASMEELLSDELKNNWWNLQHHIDSELQLTDKLDNVINSLKYNAHTVLKREAKWDDGNHGDCREGVCSNKEDDNPEIEEWFSQYHNLSSIYQWYVKLSDAHPDRVHFNKTIGRSFHQREIIALHITDKNGAKNKPVVYLQCLLHSREWISGSVCMYISYRLATPHPSDTTLLRLLNEVEFVIVPVANPDGYYATWVEYPKYRLWRKNVQDLSNTECAGVDLNRNFDSHWNQDSTSYSDDPCSELYHGPSAGSECEVKVLTSFIKSLGVVVGAIDYHSYHQKILYPPAFSGDDVTGDDDVIREAAVTVATVASQGGVVYTPHRMYDLYSASGTFADWLLDYRHDPDYPLSNNLIPLTIELRPHPTNGTTYTGFLLPTNQILPSCREMSAAFITFSEVVQEKHTK